MPYATQQEMIDRYGERVLRELTDRAASGSIDSGVLDQALNDATALIDGYLLERYSLPLSSTPRLLTVLACQVAFYQLHPHGAPEEVRGAYRDAVKTLEAIASGKIAVPGASGTEIDSREGAAEVAGPARTFSRDSMTGF